MLIQTATNEQLLNEYAACGAPELFNELYRRLHARVCGFIRRLVRNVSLSEDLAQDTWINVLAHASQFHGRSLVISWVCAIAKNVVISRSRKPGYGREQQASESFFRLASRPVTFTPAHAAIRDEEQRHLFAAMLELTTETRQVVELVDIEELEYTEAARILEVPVGTIRSRRHRAIAKLKQHLAA